MTIIKYTRKDEDRIVNIIQKFTEEEEDLIDCNYFGASFLEDAAAALFNGARGRIAGEVIAAEYNPYSSCKDVRTVYVREDNYLDLFPGAVTPGRPGAPNEDQTDCGASYTATAAGGYVRVRFRKQLGGQK